MATSASTLGRSFSADVLNRILTILHQEGAIKKTNLAGKTRLNYLTCVKYLDLLKHLGLVHITIDAEDGGERFSISEFGTKFNSNLFSYLQKEPTTPVQYIDDGKNFADFMQNKINNQMLENIDQTSSIQENAGKIMLVDDEKDILFTYQLFLAEGGYNVEVFSNSSEALRQFALTPRAYQLVITDIRMSSINGLQLYHGIRAFNQSIKVIFLSALDAADELVSILPGLNKHCVLKKPVNKEIFAKAVALALR